MIIEKVTLGRSEFAVRELPFGDLRIQLPRINRIGPALAANVLTDAVMEDLAEVIACGVGITVEELGKLPVKLPQIGLAFNAIVRAAGIEELAESGEPKPVATGTGTTSMPTSRRSPAGRGTKSAS